MPLKDFKILLDESLADPELDAFVWVAATTGAQKGEVLARKWEEVKLESAAPHIYLPRSQNGRPKRLPLADEAIRALKNLPSFGANEYLFPADHYRHS